MGIASGTPADDYIVLEPLTPKPLLVPRALEDLNRLAAGGQSGRQSPPAAAVREGPRGPTRKGSVRWKDMLWRTFDLLKQHGYAGINFEAHVPQPLTKARAGCQPPPRAAVVSPPCDAFAR